MKTVYRIRKGELYSTGGSTPRFDKKGKTWPSKAALSNHIGLVRGGVYAGAVIEEYEVVETLKQTLSLTDYTEALNQRRAIAQAKKDERYAAERARLAARDLERAQKAHAAAIAALNR